MKLEVRGLTKAWGTGKPAVAGMSHVFPEGRISVLLGPSGSGKSTALWMIAGLADPDAGAVILDGRNVTNVPAEKRDIGMVFQSYALFPHLNVLENVAFGLRTRGVGKAERHARAREVLETVRLGSLESRPVDRLSGGEQQRVALARALAFRPRVLLLDEPLSALDAKLREDLRAELFGFLRALALTTVYVTHDQSEALALGDELVLLHEGRIEQTGRPADVYRRPASPFVARFLGAANLIAAEVPERRDALRLPFATIGAPPGAAAGPCWALLRPEDLEVAAPGEGDFTATLASSRFLGPVRRLRVLAGGQELLVDAPNDLAAAEGAAVSLRVKRANVVVFARDGGQAPAPAFPVAPLLSLDTLWLQVAGTLCNLQCTHCFISCSPTNDSHGMLSLADVRRRLKEAEDLGVKEYYFTGGEPFLNREIFEILEETLRAGPASVLTNGVLIRPETAARLKALSDASDYSLDIRISIDGWNAATNDPIRGEKTFERILTGIRNLAEAGLNPVVTVTEACDGAGTSEGRGRFLEFLRSIGLPQPRLKVMPLLRIGAEKQRLRAYESWETLRDRELTAEEAGVLPCTSARMVTSKGVYVCPILIDKPEAKMGETLKDTMRPFPLSHQACFTCHETGFSCRT